jgi:two-component system, NtrC family, sensor kinase
MTESTRQRRDHEDTPATPDSGSRRESPSPPPSAAVGRSLTLKFTLIIVALLALTIGVAPWGAIKMQEGQLLKASEDRLLTLHKMVKAVFTTYMLSHDRDSIQTMIDATKSHQDIYRMRILSPDGEIRFSSERNEIGKHVGSVELSAYYGRPDPVVLRSGNDLTQWLTRPLFNEPACLSCHGTEHKVVGVLQVGLSLDQTQEQLARLRRSALVATLITLGVVAIGIWLSLSALVYHPLGRLVTAMARVESGDLSTRAEVSSRDEIGQLARRLNEMISQLDAAQNELNAYHQEQLARADRLATIGEMAAAIAHEIRNPLTGIRGVLSVLSRGFARDDPRHEIVHQTDQLIDRLNKSIEDILAYSRPSHPRLQSVLLDDIISPVLSLLDGEARKAGVQLSAEHSDGTSLPMLNVDPHQIQQVLVNLVLNAIHATPPGGWIRIRTATSNLDGTETVLIEVEDSGEGMSPEAAEKAFHPFFSTKAQGTGLGLPIAKQIVEQHKGNIALASGPGKGTRVTVRLPAAVGATSSGG